MKLSVCNLSFCYFCKGKKILDAISFDVDSGSIVSILGLNGSGKSTLIKNIVGVLKPISGKITIDDIDICELTNLERSKLISYVSQSINRVEGLTVKDYLSTALFNQLGKYCSPQEKDYLLIEKQAKELNIENLLNKDVDKISGGERQKVAICASLLQNTPIIVLDEPTSALDIANQSMILNLLKDIAYKTHKIIILSTHDPNQALKINSRVITIKDGKILDDGSASDIIEIEKLKKIYGENICYSKDLPYEEISFK